MVDNKGLNNFPILSDGSSWQITWNGQSDTSGSHPAGKWGADELDIPAPRDAAPIYSEFALCAASWCGLCHLSKV